MNTTRFFKRGGAAGGESNSNFVLQLATEVQT
jgi:hypothetical protein